MKRLVILVPLALFAAEAPAPKPQRIDTVHMLRFQVLQSEMRALNAEVCGEAGVKPSECKIDWPSATVSRAPVEQK